MKGQSTGEKLIRCNLMISEKLNDALNRVGTKYRYTRSELVRMALGKLFKDPKFSEETKNA